MDKLFLLICGHALADFALQPDIMTKGKNWNNKPVYIPEGQKYTPCWPYWMAAHGLIHGLAVVLITNNIYYGIGETIFHIFFDCLKCGNITDPHGDQFFHIITKILWTL